MGNMENDFRTVIWTYAGQNKDGERPNNLNIGVIFFLNKIFDDPNKEDVQKKIIEFKVMVELASRLGYSVRDVSTETFNDPTVIISLEQAREIADRQMKLIPKTEVRGRR